MVVYSIDPGSKGAMSVFKDSKYVKTLKYTSIDEWYDEIYYNEEPSIILVEKVHSMPKQGVVSTFNFGRKLGEIEAMCKILNIEPVFVSPRDWKKYFGLINKPKSYVCNVALKLEPNLACVGSRGGCLDGVADSYLIGKYYIERILNENQTRS